VNDAVSVDETHSPAIPARRNPLVFPPRERFALLLPVMSLLQTANPARDSEPTLKKPPVVRWHPGWVILGIASAGVFMSAPGQSYSVAAFIDPMLTELHLNRTGYSAAYLVATLLGGLTLPWVGRKVDEFGARKMMPLVAVLLGFACVWMGSIQHIVGLYIGFSMIRCLGQGSLTLISTWLIGEWFEHRRGLATGLVGLGGALSVMFFPWFNDQLIGQFGWRNAWMILAAIVWIVLVVPGVLFIRNRPEDMGLLPDWKKPGDKTTSPKQKSVEKKTRWAIIEPTTDSWTVQEARQTPTFWKLVAAVSVCSMIGTGLIFHQTSLLAEKDVLRENALWMLGVQAMVATLVSIVAGYLTDRVEARYMLAFSMLFLSLALLLLIFLPSPKFAFLYSALLGMQGGIIRTTGTVVWINYYGRLHQGAVRGFALSLMVIAAAFGPLPLALANDNWGSYQTTLIAFLILPVIAGFTVLSAKQPLKTDAAPTPN
jgi:MFS family permease